MACWGTRIRIWKTIVSESHDNHFIIPQCALMENYDIPTYRLIFFSKSSGFRWSRTIVLILEGSCFSLKLWNPVCCSTSELHERFYFILHTKSSKTYLHTMRFIRQQGLKMLRFTRPWLIIKIIFIFFYFF